MKHKSCFQYCPGAVVRVKIQGNKASFTPKRVLVEKGSNVTWKFIGVPKGYQPLIRFTAPQSSATASSQQAAVPRDPMPGNFPKDGGPENFEMLGMKRRRVVGLGWLGDEGEHQYHTILVPRRGDKLRILSGRAFIEYDPMGRDPDDPPVDP